MKILFLPTWYPSDVKKIHAPFIREHAIAASLYDEVVVLYPHETPFLLKKFYRYYEVLDTGIPTAYAEFNVFIPGMFHKLYMRATRKGFAELSRSFAPDIVHGHVAYPGGVAAALLAKKLGLPLVLTEQASAFPQLFERRQAVKLAIAALKQAQLILPVSNSLQQRIEKEGVDGPFRIVPNIADTNLFYPKQGNISQESKPNQFKMVAVGGLIPRKGMDVLLRATATLPFKDRARLDIVGDGPDGQKLQQLARELGIDGFVKFHGSQPKSGVAEVMRNSHLFVHPSFGETFGCVVAEAMACGKPVVVTKCGGPEEFVTEECGVVVPTKDEEAFAQGIKYIYENYERYNPEAIAAYARQNFSHEAVGKQLHQAYEQVRSLFHVDGNRRHDGR